MATMTMITVVGSYYYVDFMAVLLGSAIAVATSYLYIHLTPRSTEDSLLKGPRRLSNLRVPLQCFSGNKKHAKDDCDDGDEVGRRP